MYIAHFSKIHMNFFFYIKSNLAVFSKSLFWWLEFHDAFALSFSLLPFFLLLLLLFLLLTFASSFKDISL